MSQRTTASAAGLRDAMTDKAISDGWITTATVDAAFRAIPRELFAHDSIPPETVYDADTALRSRRGTNGTLRWVVSAPRLQRASTPVTLATRQLSPLSADLASSWAVSVSEGWLTWTWPGFSGLAVAGEEGIDAADLASSART